MESSSCDLQPGVSEIVRAIVCPIQLQYWKVPKNATAVQNAGCLLGKNRCSEVIKIPTPSDVSPSPPPPAAKNQRYQELAMMAERVVPQNWFRQAFSEPQFLLTPTNKDFPRRMFDIKVLSNKKLRNMYECVTRQQFIRKSLDFALNSQRDSTMEENSGKNANNNAVCMAMKDPVVQRFYSLWTQAREHLDGSFSVVEEWQMKIWLPNVQSSGELLMAAHEVLEYFYRAHGGIWTGCFALEKNAECRGALAAAAMVTATYQLADIAGRQRSFSESNFVRGYILASLGRHLLHGDSSTIGDQPRTVFRVKTYDFIVLQNAFLQLYIDSFGRIYTEQLLTHIPVTLAPDFTVRDKRRWMSYAARLEPVYSSVRNWMYTESFNLIDFGPYFPLVAFPEVRQQLMRETKGRRVLVDVGANGFFASPKYLLDSYAPFLPFTDAIMVEPEPHFSASVPKIYSKKYNITHLPIYAEVATNSSTDMLRLLPTLVTKDDFVVLKFDVDPNRFAQGPTMEWGFLFEIMQNPEVVQLVDEVYIELHYHFPLLYWQHYHSNWEALDTFRYLRNHGAIVHSWP